MTIWDDRILEHVRADEGSSVGELEDKENVRVTNTHVSRRCNKLAEEGLLRPLGNGVYVITPEGEGYLDGEYDAENHIFLENGADEDNGMSAGESPSEI
jgi:predicted transcriptional regulator